jgi:hypothetical protein
MAEALAEQAQATNAKLDSLMEQFASLTPWVKNMNSSMAELSITAAMLKLHAEDTAAWLGALESRPPPVLPQAEPISTAPLGEVLRRPDGHGCDNTPWGQVCEIPELVDCPRKTVRLFLIITTVSTAKMNTMIALLDTRLTNQPLKWISLNSTVPIPQFGRIIVRCTLKFTGFRR